MQRTRSQANKSSTKQTASKSVSRNRKNQESSDEEEQKQQQTLISNNKNNRSRRNQVQQQSQVVFQKGAFIAFLDPSDLNTFRIGQVLEDLNEDDDEVLVDIFGENAPLVYKKQASKQTILDYTIITDVTTTLEKPKKKGEQPTVTITKQHKNKVTKLMDSVVSRIEQERLDNESDNDDEDDEEEEENEEEIQKEESQIKDSKNLRKDSPATVRGRKIVKGRASVLPDKNVSSITRSQKSVTSKKGKPQPKKAVTAKSLSKKVQEKGDEDMDEEQETQKQNEMIDTSSKKRTTSKQKIIEESVIIGQKRKRQSSKTPAKSKNEDIEEPSESFNEDSELVSKKRKKGADGKEQPIKGKAKKVQKKPTIFKKGKWNPDVILLDLDKFKEDKQSELYLECCIRCNNKNIIRAAITENERLLKMGIEQKKKISQLTAYWSPEIQITPLEYMVKQNNHEMLEILLHPKLKVPAHSTYDQERVNFYNERIGNPLYLMQYVDSGMVNKMAYGTRVRKVQMTRGNRQGNNAFLEYIDNQQKNPLYNAIDEDFIKRILQSDTVTFETLKQMQKLNGQIEAYFQSQIYEAVRAGNRDIAHQLLKSIINHSNFGFNQLHCDVLSNDAELEKVLKQSVTKKSNTNRDITPLHCACINPNPKYLRALMDVNPEITLNDADLRRPIHYAAACEGPEPLRILITAGVSLGDFDNQKMTCLHIAAITGRADNARLILQSAPNLLNVKDKKSMTPMAYACKYGRTEVVKVFIEFKIKINVGAGLERMPPLSWAAAYGHYDLCEFLVQNKGRVLGKDKFKRSPLTMAVRNGHSKIASLLLQYGAEWNHTDSSMNTPLHYAAAYGWMECIDILIQVGADINAQNSWKITPINIAMLQSHTGCVKRILEEPNVDVNGKDDKGRTLIMLALFVLDEQSIDFISFLLKKGADPNIADLEGKTSLHYIAKYQFKDINNNGVIDKERIKRQQEIQIKVTQVLIQNGADLTIKDNLKKTPFSLCLDGDNAPLLEFLQDKISINKEPDLLFAFKDKIFNEEYQKILIRLLENEQPSHEAINILNDEGLTPFLCYLKQFSANFDGQFTLIQQRVNQQSFYHQAQFDRYRITNQTIFDKFADAHNAYNYNPLVSEEQKRKLSLQFMESAIVEPLIKVLKFLLDKGAESQAVVGKLKKYRDIELLKRIQAEKIANGEPIEKPVEDKVKRREEKLNEMQKRQLGQKPFGRKRKPYAQQLGAGIGSNPDEDNTIDKYDIIGGEKVLREYGQDGQRNAIHLIIRTAQPKLLDYLIQIGIDVDQFDYDQVTPFLLLSQAPSGGNYPEYFENAFDKLLDINVRIDSPDSKGRTAFLNFYDQQKFDLSYRMLDMGANVNQMDNSGLFALKYSLIRRQNNKIQELLDRGANINQIDNKGRNLLHHAINMSSATADATFETEQFLIDRGVDINLRDNKTRTPLHYAFVKIQDWQASSQIDPIETVSSICGCKGLELDVPDKWQKTPLHYASQRGASICAMYLIARGADMERKDIYGNTSLAVGLMYRHYNYGILIIQKGASVLPLSHFEDPERIKKMWEEQDKKQKALYLTQKKNLILEDSEMNGDQPSKQKKHRNMFNKQSRPQFDYGYDDEYDEEEEEDDYDSEDQYHETVFNQQNAFGQQVYAQKSLANPWGQNAAPSWGFAQPAPKQIYAAVGVVISKNDKEGVSMFKLSIRGGQQGLAYLMLDNGYDLMLAMQDAMDEKKFMLVLTLLSKNPNDEIVQSKNSKGQNLFHILSMNAAGCSFEHLQRIYETLKKRGVDTKAKDNFGRTALHYAVISQSLPLVKMLLQINEGYNPNEVDNEGFTPLSLCLKGNNVETQYFNPQFKIDNIFLTLVTSGADVNFVYPEDLYKSDLKDEELLYSDSYDPTEKYYTSILINTIRSQQKNEVLRNNIIGLIEYGAKLDIADSDGRDPIMHAVIQNNTMVVKMLLENKKALNQSLDLQDLSGKSAVHFVVNPLRYGSYENVEILQMLAKHNFNLQLEDAKNMKPIQYALQQESGVLLKELAKLVGQQEDLQRFQRKQSTIESSRWPECKVDYEIDAEAYMEYAEERENRLAKEKNQKVPVDTVGRFEKSYEVYYENEKPWDIYLTKVDLKNGIYGDYVFYKMQLLYDSNRDLYVVFTRWGRIGEHGMNQRTPFNNLDEAKIEYNKIFKQKTGGNKFEELDTFSRVKKKYNLTRVNYITVHYKDFLQPFDFEKCPKTRLSKPIFDLFEEISNVTMYQRAMNQFGLDSDALPFSGLKKQSLVEARELLMEIQEALKEDQELAKEGIKADFEKLTLVKEKISELSSRYYELIPQSKYKNQIARPINNLQYIKTEYDLLENLNNIEFASKILLGALLKQNEMNPVDYVYQALNLMIDPLDNEGAEFEIMKKYLDNTGLKTPSNQNYTSQQYEIANIFKIQRKGEAELIQAYKEVPNHYLLFHGSAIFNFMGILSQGLRVAPPEAPPTGYMFGKGIYFADMYEKSLAYAMRGYAQQDSYFMLMCEVVVGKSKELYRQEYIEKLEHPYHSVKGCGRRGPGYKNTVTCPNGVKIPLGNVINYHENNVEMQKQLILQHNEYIVYNSSQVRMRYIVQIQKKDLKKQNK